MESAYDNVVELVAAHPVETAETLISRAIEHDIDESVADDLLSEALDQGDIVEFSGQYWVMRKGTYAFDAYDHPV